jgi:hypothetical protein
MYDSEEYSIKEIVSATGISQGSLYRAVNRRRIEEIKKWGALSYFFNFTLRSTAGTLSLGLDY